MSSFSWLHHIPWRDLLPFLVLLLQQVHLSESSKIRNLSATAGFKSVLLKWERQRSPREVNRDDDDRKDSFKIRYCELQAWGPHHCRTVTADLKSGSALVKTADDGVGGHEAFAFDLRGLRMDTDYDVRITDDGDDEAGDFRFPDQTNSNRERRDFQSGIVVGTKGFSARATSCNSTATQVHLDTGPNFAGRIYLEEEGGGGKSPSSSQKEDCSYSGDPTSDKTSVVFTIEHFRCSGVRVSPNSVRAFVVVQESAPILTHSTRRFLLVCEFKPSTVTVQAGLNMPPRHPPAPSDELESITEVLSFKSNRIKDSTGFRFPESEGGSRSVKSIPASELVTKKKRLKLEEAKRPYYYYSTKETDEVKEEEEEEEEEEERLVNSVDAEEVQQVIRKRKVAIAKKKKVKNYRTESSSTSAAAPFTSATTTTTSVATTTIVAATEIPQQEPFPKLTTLFSPRLFWGDSDRDDDEDDFLAPNPTGWYPLPNPMVRKDSGSSSSSSSSRHSKSYTLNGDVADLYPFGPTEGLDYEELRRDPLFGDGEAEEKKDPDGVVQKKREGNDVGFPQKSGQQKLTGSKNTEEGSSSSSTSSSSAAGISTPLWFTVPPDYEQPVAHVVVMIVLVVCACVGSVASAYWATKTCKEQNKKKNNNDDGRCRDRGAQREHDRDSEGGNSSTSASTLSSSSSSPSPHYEVPIRRQPLQQPQQQPRRLLQQREAEVVVYEAVCPQPRPVPPRPQRQQLQPQQQPPSFDSRSLNPKVESFA